MRPRRVVSSDLSLRGRQVLRPAPPPVEQTAFVVRYAPPGVGGRRVAVRALAPAPHASGLFFIAVVPAADISRTGVPVEVGPAA